MKTTFKKFLLLVAMVGLTTSMHGGAIHKAVAEGDLKKVKKILKKDPDKVNQKALFRERRPPKAMLSGYKRKFDVYVEISRYDRGDTPLQVAARSFASGEVIVPIAEFLLSKGANVIEVETKHNPEVSISLLNHGAPLSKTFDLADIIRKRGPIAENLAVLAIERGVDIFGGPYDKSALAELFKHMRVGRRGRAILTVYLWNNRIMKAMLRKHRDKIFTKPVFIWANNKLDKSRRLQAYKLFTSGDIRRKHLKNRTALHYAAAGGDVAVVSYLIENGAADDLGEKDADNKRPIDHANDAGMRAYLELAMQKRGIPVE